MSFPGNSTTDPAAMTPRPGGLPGMIADSLRQSPDTAGNSRASRGLPVAPTVPFVKASDPLSEGEPATFQDRFGDWSEIRRLSSRRESR